VAAFETPARLGGETHQVTTERSETLTTNQGVAISDGQNSLKLGERGPTLLEDFILREKITHFDHERIPERVVHARGYGAKGYFQPYAAWSQWTRAAFLSDPVIKTPVFVRFSTVAGSEGSPDCARDIRGFSVKFYTSEGNFDLVGNNIPVFFIQDAMKFPDLIHSVKPEPDRGFPQAQSAHDTFWDFVSLNTEATHTLLWVMSDRALPRSFRMMEGFGVHTFRFVDNTGKSTYVKFHWRPKLGCASLLWDEAVCLNGADPDFHRRDLWESIKNRDFPEWEFCVQAFDQATADGFAFDVLDPTKLIPEELVPLTPLGKMVLDENVEDFFAETEQVAFCPSHLVPGIDFTNDPLLQGRLFSYLDTQLSRLGSPNFHEIPVNKPRCPMRNFQQGGHMRMQASRGPVGYEPNSMGAGPRENPSAGFQSYPRNEKGEALRTRPASFADHYSQAALFWNSMTKPEQEHIVSAFVFELSKVRAQAIRQRMVCNLINVDLELAEAVAEGLGHPLPTEAKAAALVAAETVAYKHPYSPTLSLLSKVAKSVTGKKLGVLLFPGADRTVVEELVSAFEGAGARVEFVGAHIGGCVLDDGSNWEVDHTVEGGPSVLFDYVALVATPVSSLGYLKDARVWLAQAYRHLKPIAVGGTGGLGFLDLPQVALKGVVEVSGDSSEFLDLCSAGRVWNRFTAF